MRPHRPVTGFSGRAEVRVLIVVEVRLYREGLANHLSLRKNLKLVGTAADRAEASSLVDASRPDVVVLDMGTRESLEIVRALRGAAPYVRILAFAIEEHDQELVACAEAGVAGYVPCDASADDLVTAIERVARGELLCPPRTAALLLRNLAARSSAERPSARQTNLTGREREIVTLLADGLSNKEIAQRLNIEVATVKNHVHSILEKLHVTTRGAAAAQVRRGSSGMVPPSALDRS